MKRFFGILFTWMLVRKVGKVKWDGDSFRYAVHYKNRYSSPLFWVIAIVYIPRYLMFGGLIEWIDQIEGCTSLQRSWGGTFKPNVSWFRRRYIIWKSIYEDVI
jgi:hypothetical protein